jgi:hypothetical protein
MKFRIPGYGSGELRRIAITMHAILSSCTSTVMVSRTDTQASSSDSLESDLTVSLSRSTKSAAAVVASRNEDTSLGVRARAIKTSSLSDREKGLRLLKLIEVGMSRQQVEAVLGSLEQVIYGVGLDPFAEHLYWRYHVLIRYNIDERVESTECVKVAVSGATETAIEK